MCNTVNLHFKLHSNNIKSQISCWLAQYLLHHHTYIYTSHMFHFLCQQRQEGEIIVKNISCIQTYLILSPIHAILLQCFDNDTLQDLRLHNKYLDARNSWRSKFSGQTDILDTIFGIILGFLFVVHFNKNL